jgi:hypothetical protein
MDEIKKLFQETRQWRKTYLSEGDSLQAAACAIRERALLDALSVLGCSQDEIRRMWKS